MVNNVVINVCFVICCMSAHAGNGIVITISFPNSHGNFIGSCLCKRGINYILLILLNVLKCLHTSSQHHLNNAVVWCAPLCLLLKK